MERSQMEDADKVKSWLENNPEPLTSSDLSPLSQFTERSTVMDAEKQKADSGADHAEKTQIFHAAESRVQFLEQKFKSSIAKSRPYFEEKQICQDQLNTQKGRIQQLQSMLQAAKSKYASSLRNLEMISESIHKARGELFEAPPAGVREPGVGAESHEIPAEPQNLEFNLDDVELESRSHSRSTSRSRSSEVNESDLEALRMKVKSLAVRPIEGGDGKQDEQESWESELNATVDKLDHLMLMREKRQTYCPEPVSLPQSPDHTLEQKPIKQLKKLDPLPLANVSLQMLPTSSNALPLNSAIFSGSPTITCDNLIHKKKRKLSLQ